MMTVKSALSGGHSGTVGRKEEAPIHDTAGIKQFWEDRASSAGASEEDVTHPDVWQRHLEIEMIKRLVFPTDRVLDIGCGNGFTTRRIAPLVREIIGIDYAEAMIRRALKESGDRRGSPTYAVKDVLTLGPEDFGLFDLAISERCLINLKSWKDQRRALSNIASVITPAGRLVFVEGSKQGRENLNKLRRAVGLETMPTVWHNIDFDEQKTLAYLRRSFSLEQRMHFGLYDFISRVAHPLIVAPDRPQYDSRINEVAAKLTLHANEFAPLSRVLGLVLRKPAHRPHSQGKGRA
jgi:SAM-dependent methyltransferase